MKRFLPLLIKYEIVTLIYLIVRLFIGDIPDTKNLILSFTGWENLGNFGWYIFVMLCLYILFCISFFISHKAASGRKALITGALILTVLSILFMLLLCFPGQRGKWFYDTILIFFNIVDGLIEFACISVKHTLSVLSCHIVGK